MFWDVNILNDIDKIILGSLNIFRLYYDSKLLWL